MKAHNKIIIGSILLSLAGIAFAAEKGQRRGPPPEALEACSSLAVGDQCQMTTPRGDVEGQCVTTPDEQLACLPEGHTQGGKRGPRPK